MGTASTWSLRALICSQLANIEVKEHVINLIAQRYKKEILKHSPTGLVPALNTGTEVIHDSLAIAEYFNERSDGALYPASTSKRARSRSLCAEMHSGFINLREKMPFTLQEVEPFSELTESIKNETSRVAAIFEQAELPFMFETAGVVDAFYSILAFRLKSYGINLEGKAGEYQQALLNWKELQKALEHAEDWEKRS